MNRAYSILTVKAVSEDERVITGVATTPAPDRMGDIVEPLGMTFKNPLPLLHQHDHRNPVGTVIFDKPTKNGITFKATLPKIEEPGPLKDRVDTAWGEVKAGLVRAVSIGFAPSEYSRLEDGGLRFIASECFELSLVTVPANADAVINTIKSIDHAVLAARGREGNAIERVETPVSPGQKSTKATSTIHGKPVMKTIAEQIAAFEAKRAASDARALEIMNKAAEEAITLDEAQEAEYDSLVADVAAIDKHLVRLRAAEVANAAAAVEVTKTATATPAAAAAARGGVRVEVKGVNLPKGTAFTRYAIALALGKGNLMQSHEIAKQWEGESPEVATVLKAAVAAGNTTDANWAAPLVEYQTMASEFAELLRPMTIIGRIPNLRRVPFNIKIPRQTAGSSASWVGEGASKPVSALAFDQITLGMTKLAGIVVLTEELVRSSSPAAEGIVRTDLQNTIVQTMDRDFVDPAKAASAGVSPASITNGVTPVVASGADADDVRSDVRELFGKFITANMSLSGSVWIMKETTALGLAMMLNPLGQPEFPGISINGGSGGTFFNLPVVLSENIPSNAGSGSPLTGAGDRIILAKADEILLADDGQVMLDASNQASLQMDSVPTNPPVAATVMVSLWQANLVGIRAERFVNWSKRRTGAVQYIDSAAYGQ